MKLFKLIAATSVLVMAGAIVLQAQSLEKRHQIELRLGMWNQTTGVRTEISPGSVSTTVGNNGFTGTVSYGHWLQENLAFTIGVGSMVANVESTVGVSGVTSENAVVARILIGAKYYFLKSSYSSSTKPFVKAGVGPFIGGQTKSEVGVVVSTESRSEMAFGGQLGAGIDFLLSRHFLLSAAVDYNLMTDFDEPIGGSSNYSGPEFGVGFSYLFGSGKS